MRNASRALVAGASLALALVLSAFIAPSAHAQLIPINIESVPPGATVYLDNADGTPLGTTPLTNVRVARGQHTLIFRLANHQGVELAVNVARRRETFRAVLHALGSVEVAAANEGAQGAMVTIDGQPIQGGVLSTQAFRVDALSPGRHQIRATREGYNPFEQWVDVRAGEVVRVSVLLERAAPTTGSILVTADVEGAAIYLDGRPTGLVTTAVIDDVPAGNHTIEIRPSGGTPVSQTLIVEAGRRAEVRARVRAEVQATTTGTIAVLVDRSGAIVRINGENLPAGTYSREGLNAGTYVVQVLLEGYEPFRREVTVTVGQTSTVDATLVPIQAPPGPINIRVSVPEATVSVDGAEFSAPFVARDPEGGSHAIRITAPGYREQSFTCNNANGSQDCNREVTLEAQQIGLRVSLTHSLRPESTARLYIDDEDVGPVPFDGSVGIGTHIFAVHAEGYQSYERQVNIQLGEGDVSMEVTLVDSSEIAAAAATSHSALPTPINHPILDASIGWPHFLELRLGIGVHELVDAGFAVRTFGRLTEFEARARVGTRLGDVRQLAAGGQVRIGGGLGPDNSVTAPFYDDAMMSTPPPTRLCDPGHVYGPTETPTRCNNQDLVPNTRESWTTTNTGHVNSFFFSLEGNLSLMLEPVATVTLWAAVDFSTDEYSGHARNSSTYADYGPSGDRICVDRPRLGMTGDFSCGRQDMARFRIGGAVEFNITREWGIWAIFEGIAAQSDDHRRIYSDIVGQVPDIRIYPRLGVSYTFF